jgi:hypothetical protein
MEQDSMGCVTPSYLIDGVIRCGSCASHTESIRFHR